MIVDDLLWKALLRLRDSAVNKDSIGWAFRNGSFMELVTIEDLRGGYAALLLRHSAQKLIDGIELDAYNKIEIPFEHVSLYAVWSINKDQLTALRNYWPLSILKHLDLDKPYILIHTAISLDGYLATCNGSSRWIGNEANLIHAHRLRALFDAVLVGSGTVKNDKPSLNVRHVEGRDPVRLVLSNTAADLSSLKKINGAKTILLRTSDKEYEDKSMTFDKVIYAKGETKKDQLLKLLKACEKENIKSILVEGGASALSAFIESGLANNIQFHMAPMLFGNGIKAVNLPLINRVDEATKLHHLQATPMGESIMITTSL